MIKLAFIDEIKKENYKQAYLFFGEENYLKRTYSEFLINKFLNESEKTMNLSVFEGKSCNVDSIIDTFNTTPFFSEKRVILVKNSGLFYSGRKDDSDSLAENLKYLPDSSYLIFVEEKIDKRNKLYKTLGEIADFCECKTPTEKEMILFVKNIFKKQNFDLPGNVCAYLLRTVAHNMDSVLQESKKLIDYKYNEKSVSIQDIDDICIKSFELRIFDLLNAIGNKKSELALSIYKNMLLMKEEPIVIISMMARQFRLILLSVKLKQEGKFNSEICSELGIREFALRDYFTQASNFSEKILISALKDLLDTDIKIKTGQINNALGVELLIVRYSA